MSDICPICKGKKTEICVECNGRGWFQGDSNFGNSGILIRCDGCQGDSYTACGACLGSGWNVLKEFDEDTGELKERDIDTFS